MKNQNTNISFKVFYKQKIASFLIKRGFSDSNIYYLIKNNNVLINDKPVRDKNDLVRYKDTIKVLLSETYSDIPTLKDNLDIVYEDNYLLAVNKPYNLDVEPTKKEYVNNLACIVNNYYQENNIESKIHLVNRLDKLTTGLVILAKNQYIHNLFNNIKITKKYSALVEGKTASSGTIKIKIEKENNSVERVVSDSGKISITKYKLVKFDGVNSLVDISILTGRTHQIRLSFKHINHPLVNDPLYGNNTNGDMYLKAYYLRFRHPITKKIIRLSI